MAKRHPNSNKGGDVNQVGGDHAPNNRRLHDLHLRATHSLQRHGTNDVNTVLFDLLHTSCLDVFSSLSVLQKHSLRHLHDLLIDLWPI